MKAQALIAAAALAAPASASAAVPGHYAIRFSGSRIFDPQGFYATHGDVVVPKSKAVK